MDEAVARFSAPKSFSIKEFDFFGEGISLRFFKRETQKTAYGALCTILFYILLLLSAYYFLGKFLQTDDPDIQFSSFRIDTPFITDLFKDNFHIFLLFKTRQGQILDLTRVQGLINLKIIKQTFRVETNTEGTKIEHQEEYDWVTCELADWTKGELAKKYIEPGSIREALIKSSGICIKNTTIPIFGSPISDRYQLLRIQVRLCLPSSEGCTATTSNDYDYLNSLKLTIGVFSANVDAENKAEPLIYGINIENSIIISKDTTQSMDVFLSQLQVNTDVGVLVEDIREQKAVVFGSSIPSSVYRNHEKDTTNSVPIVELNIESSNLVQSFKRSYVNFFDTFGNIGGTADVILFGIVLCYTWYNTMMLDRTLPKLYVRHMLPQDLSNNPKNEEIITEIIEETLSLENLVKCTQICDLLNSTLLTKEQRENLALAHFYKKKKNKEDSLLFDTGDAIRMDIGFRKNYDEIKEIKTDGTDLSNNVLKYYKKYLKEYFNQGGTGK